MLEGGGCLLYQTGGSDHAEQLTARINVRPDQLPHGLAGADIRIRLPTAQGQQCRVTALRAYSLSREYYSKIRYQNHG